MSEPVQISDLVLYALSSRLSDASTGINPLFIKQAAVYDVDPSWFEVDFGPDSNNFMYGQISPDMLEQSGIFRYPFACLYILESAQDNATKFGTFSGLVRVIFDVYLSWRKITGVYNFEKYPMCVESTVVNVVNGIENQDWGKPITYNGNVICRRGPITFAGENWRQKVGFSFIFRVDT